MHLFSQPIYNLMDDATPDFTDELKHDLYGERVGRPHAFVCDYCDAEISIAEPVMYEALRVVDMPNLEFLLDSPEEWILNAARCRNCEIESLEPATDGFDEALILLSINESNGILSADTSKMTVVDISPDGEGYYPPLVPINIITEIDDPGYARWTRTKGVLNGPKSDYHFSNFAELMRKAVKQSKEVPPSIDL
jgi:hypothetical protein